MEAILKALTWTFVHSIWQGLFAALLAALIISATGKSKARLRYNLLGIVFLGFLSTVVITFIFQFQQNDPASVASSAIAGQGLANGVGENLRVLAPAGFIADITIWFNTNNGLFLLIWFLFFLINCLKLITGIAAVNRLKNYRTYPVPAEWKLKLGELKDSIGIRKTITMLQSELIKVPVALGFLKPVILFPVGLLSNLPPEQVEAILLHELGHIRRKDFLVNFLQHFAEAVFFFNPAIIWISSLLRQEREACCDDIVIEKTGQKRNYLNALVSFQEYSLGYNSYAVGISAKKQHLLSRVKRILTNENRKLGIFEKSVLLSGLVLFSAFTYMTREKPAPVKPRLEPVQVIARVQHAPQAVQDTVPAKKEKPTPAISNLKEKPLPRDKDRKIKGEKDRKTPPGKDWKLKNEKDWDKAAVNKEDVLNQIIELKKEMGVKKEKIGVKKEQLKAVEGKNKVEEKAIKKAIEKERDELEGNRDVLEEKRELLEKLKSDDQKRKQKERNDKPRVLFEYNKVERNNTKHYREGAGKGAGLRANLFLKKKPEIQLDKTKTLEFKLENMKLDKQEFQFKMNQPIKPDSPKSPTTPEVKTMLPKKASI